MPLTAKQYRDAAELLEKVPARCRIVTRGPLLKPPRNPTARGRAKGHAKQRQFVGTANLGDNLCAPVTCVIGRRHLDELGKSLRTRDTGGGCAERPKCMRLWSNGSSSPGGRSAGNSAPVARGRACGAFLLRVCQPAVVANYGSLASCIRAASVLVFQVERMAP